MFENVEHTRDWFRRRRRRIAELLPKECVNCKSTGELHLHHVIPLEIGGTNNLSNIVPLCERCHRLLHGGVGNSRLASEGKKARSLDGKWAGGTAPFGYVVERQDHEARLIVEPDEASLIVSIFDRYLAGSGTRLVAKDINALGMRTRQGIPFAARTVSDILKNRVYCGYVVHRETNSQKTETIVRGIHDPIISEETYERVQRLFVLRRSFPGRAPRGTVLPD